MYEHQSVRCDGVHLGRYCNEKEAGDMKAPMQTKRPCES